MIAVTIRLRRARRPHVHACTHADMRAHPPPLQDTHTHFFAKYADSAAAAVTKCTVRKCKSGPGAHQRTRKNENVARKRRARMRAGPHTHTHM